MEAGNNEDVVKPTRAPDYVSPIGHAFWWDQMVFMHVYGNVYKIHVDQDDGSLYYCLPELLRKGKVKFGSQVRALYDKWWHESFEANFLGEE